MFTLNMHILSQRFDLLSSPMRTETQRELCTVLTYLQEGGNIRWRKGGCLR